MTTREPQVGDTVWVDGAYGKVSYVSSFDNGIDVKSLSGVSLRSYAVEDYEDIVYVDEAVPDVLENELQKVLDNVSHPAHYAHPSGIEVIDITKHESFLRGNIIKYVLRAPYKGSELEDLQKAAQYLQWEIERVQGTTSN